MTGLEALNEIINDILAAFILMFGIWVLLKMAMSGDDDV